MSDIVVSYARSTEAAARRVIGALRSLGYGVWWDNELPAHQSFTEVIAERIDAAKAVVVLWSAAAAKSEWVQSEADRARSGHKLVQLTLDGAPLPMPFDRIQCASLVGWSGDLDALGWKSVVTSVRTLAGSPSSLPSTRREHAAAEPLLAVLAFDNLSGDADLLYFSDGVSEEILQTVVRTTSLKVIGRSSSLQFRGAEKAARHVAAALGCTHILDGSVRRSGNRVRIAATLVECAGQTSVWSDRFDRDLSDVFALQDEIAEAVAKALKSKFAPSQSGKIDPAAYDLYLRARSSSPGVLGAFDTDLLRQATALAPDFAQAWSALALARALEATHDGEEAFEMAAAEAQAAAEKALALNANSGTAYAAQALLIPVCGHFSEAEALFQKALATSPDDPESLEKYSRWLHSVGRTKEAFAHIAHAHRIDPLYHQGANWYAVFLSFGGRLDEAFAVWDQARDRWPQFDILTINPLLSAAAIRDWARVDALVAWSRSVGLDTPLLRDAIEAVRRIREPTAASGALVLERLTDQVEKSGTVSLNALTAAWDLGFHDEVFAFADRASFRHLFEPGGRLSPGDYGLHVLFNPANSMRFDRRFLGLCDKLGLCSYWAKSNLWPDLADDVSYDFKTEVRRMVRD